MGANKIAPLCRVRKSWARCDCRLFAFGSEIVGDIIVKSAKGAFDWRNGAGRTFARNFGFSSRFSQALSPFPSFPFSAAWKKFLPTTSAFCVNCSRCGFRRSHAVYAFNNYPRRACGIRAPALFSGLNFLPIMFRFQIGFPVVEKWKTSNTEAGSGLGRMVKIPDMPFFLWFQLYGFFIMQIKKIFYWRR